MMEYLIITGVVLAFIACGVKSYRIGRRDMIVDLMDNDVIEVDVDEDMNVAVRRGKSMNEVYVD